MRKSDLLCQSRRKAYVATPDWPILGKLAPRRASPASARSADGSPTDTAVGAVPEASRPLGTRSSGTAMAPKGGSKQQSEEDLLLQDFSRNLSAKSSALFFGNAFIVSAIPICECWEQAGRGGRWRVGLDEDVAGPGGPARVNAGIFGLRSQQLTLSSGKRIDPMALSVLFWDSGESGIMVLQRSYCGAF